MTGVESKQLVNQSLVWSRRKCNTSVQVLSGWMNVFIWFLFTFDVYYTVFFFINGCSQNTLGYHRPPYFSAMFVRGSTIENTLLILVRTLRPSEWANEMTGDRVELLLRAVCFIVAFYTYVALVYPSQTRWCGLVPDSLTTPLIKRSIPCAGVTIKCIDNRHRIGIVAHPTYTAGSVGHVHLRTESGLRWSEGNIAAIANIA